MLHVLINGQVNKKDEGIPDEKFHVISLTQRDHFFIHSAFKTSE